MSVWINTEIPPVILAFIIRLSFSSESVAALKATVQKPKKAPLPSPNAACFVNRDPQSIQLIAVSKKQPKTKIIDLIKEGHLEFGENQLQEITGKWNDILDLRQKIKLHFISNLDFTENRDLLL